MECLLFIFEKSTGDYSMGIMSKMANAQKTYWVSEGMSETEIKTTVVLAKIYAKIERCRINMGFTQKEFVDYIDYYKSS